MNHTYPPTSGIKLFTVYRMIRSNWVPLESTSCTSKGILPIAEVSVSCSKHWNRGIHNYLRWLNSRKLNKNVTSLSIQDIERFYLSLSVCFLFNRIMSLWFFFSRTTSSFAMLSTITSPLYFMRLVYPRSSNS